MKKTPHALTRLFTLLLASLTILSISVAAAGTAGSSSDPLVTLSYLNEKFLPVDLQTAFCRAVPVFR